MYISDVHIGHGVDNVCKLYWSWYIFNCNLFVKILIHCTLNECTLPYEPLIEKTNNLGV